MTFAREKILAIATGGVLLAVVGLFLVRALIFSPASHAQQRIDELTEKIRLAEIERTHQQKQLAHLVDLAGRTLGDDELRIAEDLRVVLTGLLHRSGLGNDQMSLKPMAGQRVPGAFREVGWIVSARGPVEQLADFFHLLDQQKFLVQIDDVSLTPVPRTTLIALQARCSTLVIDLPAGRKMPPTVSPVSADDISLDTEERQRVVKLIQRDLFLPYLTRPAVVEQPQRNEGSPDQPGSPPSGPGAPSLSRFQVVGLPSWAGEMDVMVKDTQTGEVRAYKTGEALAGGRIVMIDYRALPRPDNAELLCTSRVIVKIGPDYWAIDLGRTLADKRRLRGNELPDELRSNTDRSDDNDDRPAT